MLKQKGSVLAALLVFLVLIVGIAVVAITFVYNTKIWAVDTENTIMTKYQDNQNIKSNLTTTVMETLGVAEAYRDDLYGVIDRTFEGRYGENGSQAVFQMLTENNLVLDSEMYKSVQRIIEAGRLEFRDAQRMLLDQQRVYQTKLDYPIRGFVLNMLGYPSDKYKDMKIGIIIDNKTRTQFETKVDEPLKLR